MAYKNLNVKRPNGAAPDNDNGAATLQWIRDNQSAMEDAMVMGSVPDWSATPASAAFTATCAGATLTVSAIASGQICPGQTIYVGAVAKGKVLSQTSGATFGTGVYQLDTANTYASATAMTAASADKELPAAEVASYGADKKVLVVLTYDGDYNCTSEKFYSWTSATGVWQIIGTNTLAYDGAGSFLINNWS